MTLLKDRFYSVSKQPENGEVHIWKVEISEAPSKLNYLNHCLSREENEHASKFIKNRDEIIYRASHIMLRLVLANYLECDPVKINYDRKKGGKPRLYGQKTNEGICFNISHSQNIAVVAVTTNAEVGLDIEYKRRLQDINYIIKHNFSIEEQQHLFSLPPNLITKGFFECWTLKEAFIKGIGKGLSYPLNTFSTVRTENGEADNKSVKVYDNYRRPWFLLPLHIHPEYCSAIALINRVPTPTVYNFSRYIEHFIS